MIFASNGASLHICTTPQTSEPSEVEYQALTFIEVKEAEGIGSFGDTASEVTFTSLGDSRTRRLKGARDAGVLEVVLGADYADAGQLALIAAEKTTHNYAFKVVFNDAPPGGTPSERYFIGMVAAVPEAIDTADNVVKLNCSIWVNSAITRVSAAEA